MNVWVAGTARAMTEHPDVSQQPEVPEPKWPTHCEFCGTELARGEVDAFPNADSEHLQTGSPATVIAQDFCPNPDCPGKSIDTAQAAEPD